MSYARTSEPDSDVYVYRTHTELIIHVRVNETPTSENTPRVGKAGLDEWEEFLASIVPFDNEYAGQTFIYYTYTDCLNMLAELEMAGVRVPDRTYRQLVDDRWKRGDNINKWGSR